MREVVMREEDELDAILDGDDNNDEDVISPSPISSYRVETYSRNPESLSKFRSHSLAYLHPRDVDESGDNTEDDLLSSPRRDENGFEYVERTGNVEEYNDDDDDDDDDDSSSGSYITDADFDPVSLRVEDEAKKDVIPKHSSRMGHSSKGGTTGVSPTNSLPKGQSSWMKNVSAQLESVSVQLYDESGHNAGSTRSLFDTRKRHQLEPEQRVSFSLPRQKLNPSSSPSRTSRTSINPNPLPNLVPLDQSSEGSDRSRCSPQSSSLSSSPLHVVQNLNRTLSEPALLTRNRPYRSRDKSSSQPRIRKNYLPSSPTPPLEYDNDTNTSSDFGRGDDPVIVTRTRSRQCSSSSSCTSSLSSSSSSFRHGRPMRGVITGSSRWDSCHHPVNEEEEEEDNETEDLLLMDDQSFMLVSENEDDSSLSSPRKNNPRSLQTLNPEVIDEILEELTEVEQAYTAQLSSLQSTTLQKDTIISALHSQLTDLQTTHEHQQTLSANQTQTLSRLRSSVQHSNNQVHTLRAQFDHMRRECAEELDRMMKERRVVVEEAEMLLRMEVEREFQEANDWYEKVGTEVEGAREEVLGLRVEVERLRLEREEVEREMDVKELDRRAEMAQLKAELASAKAQIAASTRNLSTSLDERNGNESTLRSNIAEARANYKATHQSLSTATAQKEDLLVENRELESMCEELMQIVEGGGGVHRRY